MSKLSYAAKKGRSKAGSFLSLPHVVLNCDDYVNLSHLGIKLLIDISMQYDGKNNGNLSATFSILKKRGWKSTASLAKALKELLAKNLIKKTRQGGRNQCCLYAVTWRPIDECGGKLDVKSTTVAPRRFIKYLVHILN